MTIAHLTSVKRIAVNSYQCECACGWVELVTTTGEYKTVKERASYTCWKHWASYPVS